MLTVAPSMPEWMREDAIDGLCFRPPGEKSYACLDLPMNRLEVPRCHGPRVHLPACVGFGLLLPHLGKNARTSQRTVSNWMSNALTSTRGTGGRIPSLDDFRFVFPTAFANGT